MTITKIEPNLINASANFTFNNVTATGNLSSLNAELGNLATANFFSGSGNNLSNIQGGNITGQVGNALLSGTVYTNAQPNITSVGTLTNLISTGTVNLTGASNVALGPVSNVKITGGTEGYVLQTDGAGNLSWSAPASGSGISNGNSNVNIPSANGNINLTAVGNTTLIVTGTGANISGTLNATGNITVGNANLGNLATANFFSGAGNNLSNISGANVTGQVGNALISGTVYTNAQPNITSVGTLTDVSVSGNGVFGGNLTVNGTLTYINSTTLSISDPIINLQTGPNGAAPVSNTGKDVGTALNYYDTSAKIAWMGWDVSNAEIAFGSNVGISSEVVTFTSLANIRSGNAQLGNSVTANYFVGNGSLLTGITSNGISNGNSNINIPTANGNINLTAVGNTTLIVTGTGANISGTANVTGNLTAGNIIAGSGSGGNITNANVISANTFTAIGNISSGNANLGNAAIANFFIGSGNNLSNISAANISGQVSNALVAGTVYTNAQPNITSVGSLTGLTVSNATGVVDFTTTANVTLGAVANLHISGGSTGQYLQTDGSGNLSWSTVAGGSTSNISNGNSNVNIPAANGNINFSAVGNANVVVITGTGANISGTANVTGNLTAGNITAGAGSGGSIIGANLISANYFTGTLANGNSNVNIPSANGNINFSAVGNANVVVITGTGANISGTANITGNLTAGNIIAGNGSGGNITNANVISANTLIALTSANFVSASNVNLGVVGNVKITGGTTGQYLQTDGTGNLSWSTVTSGSTSNISNGNSNVNIPAANGNINFSAVGNANVVVITGTGANISGTANVTGNLVAGNITAGAGSGGSIIGANLISANYFTGALANGNSNVNIPSANGNVNITAVGNTTLIVTGTGANVSGTLKVTGQSNLGAVGNVVITGGTTGQYLQTDGAGNLSWSTVATGSTSNISNGNSNVNIPSANGNINFSAVGNANVVVITGTGANISGTANVTGNLTAGNITAGAGTGGSITGGNLVSANYFTGTLTTNAQPNITSVGSLTGLTVSNSTGTIDFTTTANVTLGAVANLHISGGSNGQYLQTDGSGTLTWSTVAGGSTSNISNGNSNVNIPSANGNINFSSAGNANVVVITGTGANITGTANITGNLSAGNIIAGSGSGGNITNANVISANTFTASGNITAGNANISGALSVTGQSNLGAVGNVVITGGTNGYVLSTNGSGGLSWIAGASGSNISNGNSNVNIPAANGNINFSAVGNANVVVITGTGANISGTANVTGNLVAGNITAGAGTGGSITGGNLVSANYFTGTLTTNAQPNITSVGTLTSLAVTGNTTSGNFIGSLANGNSNVNIPAANGNINFSAAGNANVVVITGTGANISGTTNVTGNLVAGNANLGNAVTANYYIGDGSLLTGIATSSLSNGNSNVNIPSSNGNINLTAVGNTTLVVTGTGVNVAGILNATGNANVGNIGAAAGVFTTIAGSLTTAAQPNITSIGTLTGLTSTGTINLTGASNVSLGAVGNVKITGGSSGQYLQTDGSGNLSWANVSSGSTSNISNGNSNVNIATANGDITMSAVGNANIVTVTGTGVNVAGTLNTTGNVTLSGANVSLGAVGNVKITGGSNTYILSTDGAGNLSWTTPPTSANVTVDNFTGNGVQTVFTLSTTPTGINQTSVNYNGATVLRTDYSLTGANITFSSAPANGSLIEVTTINLTSGGGGGGITAQDLLSPFLLMGA